MAHPASSTTTSPHGARQRASLGSTYAPPIEYLEREQSGRMSLPSPPELRRYTTANKRRHAFKAVVRVLALVSIDLLVFLSLRYLVQMARDAVGIGSLFHGVAQQYFPAGAIRSDRLALGLILGLLVVGAYGSGDRRKSARRLFMASVIATGLEVWPRFWSDGLLIASGRALTMVSLFWLALSIGRKLLDRIVRKISPLPRNVYRAVLIGDRSECARLLDRSARLLPSDFEVVGTMETHTEPGLSPIRRLADLEHHLQELGADTVIACGNLDEVTFERVVRAAIAAECHLLSADHTLTHPGLQPSVVWRRGRPLIEWRKPGLRATQLLLKRMLDIVVGGIVFVVLVPLMATVALLVRLGSKGPIVFRQSRLGQHGQLFDCYKFRSMYVDAEERLRQNPELYAEYVRNDYKLPSETDTRITPIGRLLRASSLDELPQLWNVLRGDMSLVGPRPIVPDELRHYRDGCLLFLSLKPGLTGAWQVKGRSNVAYPARAFIELEYVSSWSLMTDISILLRTLPAVMLRRGAH